MWSVLTRTDPMDPECAPGATAVERAAGDISVSPRYDINDDKCLWGEPNRAAVWIPRTTFHETYCLHMSAEDSCTCQTKSIQFDAYSKYLANSRFERTSKPFRGV
jgi:hypothetical protein